MNILEHVYKWNGELKKRTTTTYLFLHHAKAIKCSVEDIHRWHQENGWDGFGYHYLVRKDGSAHRGRPEITEGAHVKGYNNNSIGICLEGDFTVEKLDNVQRAGLINLIIDILKRYPNIKLVRHLDYADTSCPGEIGFVNILADVDNIVLKNKVESKKVEYVTKEEFLKLEEKLNRLINVFNDRIK